ncbi:MAG: gliding motility-associated C-terminal domain-containing protein [Bacteroidales bacterium]|nr:gliding motility-associated C-terminal domain-containing protein [Bacteroidales bacterium]
MISVLSTPLLLLASLTSSDLADAVSQPRDTAYIDEQTYIDNLADSVQGADRSFVGPGPILVHFEAEVDTDTIDYVAWEISDDQSFQSTLVTYHVSDVDYTFSESGTYYARFNYRYVGDDSDGSYSETYTIQVTESVLQIPNLITPDSPTGTNQVFKVKYQSLTKFEMWVFNRWGQQLFHTKDPSQGWDGTQSGKPVPTGAYYYLIKATGTDGIHYNKKGDINVLRVNRVSGE